jgi:hypothetical protein
MTNSFFSKARKFRIPKIVKRIFNLIVGLFLTSCFFFVAYMDFINGWKDLNKFDKFEGLIAEKGITNYSTSTSGRYRTTFNKQAFFFKLNGLNQTLAVYNSQQNYGILDSKLFVGDTIKVFYNHSNLVDEINLETIQIEKKNQVILDKQDFQVRSQIEFYIILILGFVVLFLTYYQDKKFKLNK